MTEHRQDTSLAGRRFDELPERRSEPSSAAGTNGGSRPERWGDAFETRLMLRRAVCMMGEQATRVFYDPNRFTRRGALPPTALSLLQDKGSAAVLDGDAHRHRKRMLMSLMTQPRIQEILRAFVYEWDARSAEWEGRPHVLLAAELPHILTRAVCSWSGIAVVDDEVEARTSELVAMYEGAGAVGPRNWRGQVLRHRTERWAREVIEEVRAGTRTVPPTSVVHIIASHRELDGTLIPVNQAAVELINILRPTVAVERFITFAAHALALHPEWRVGVQSDDDHALECFVQEVRRFYPFFPLVAGRVLTPFEWRGHAFVEGTWVMLDLYGTNHDPRIWEDPDAFRPARFASLKDNPYTLIPQGGGAHAVNHRCAGEAVTVELIKCAVRLLTRTVEYDVPAQDLTIDMSRLPAVPRSRVVLSNVRRIHATHARRPEATLA